MKILYIIFFTCGFCTLIFAQTPIEYFYGNQKIVYENPYGWGYIAGTNEYLDKGKYQRFDFYDQGALNAATLYFGVMKIVGEPDSIWIVVRDVTESGAPGEILTKYSTVTSEFNVSDEGTTVFFSNPIPINGGFIPDRKFIGFEWIETADDSFCVYADSNGFGDLENRAWEQFVDGVFQEFNNPGDYSWHLDADLWIKALLDFPQDVQYGENFYPQTFNLSQNYPNPFNPGTIISYYIPYNEFVTLKIYDVLGNEVATLVNENQQTGIHHYTFNASNYSITSGIYFYRLQAGFFSETKKMILLR